MSDRRDIRSFPAKPEPLAPSEADDHFIVIPASPFEMTSDEIAALVGKTALVSTRYVSEVGELVSHEWFVGRVVGSDRGQVAVKREGTEELSYLPPDRLLFRPAPPGEYRLTPPGDAVTDPDLLVTTTVLSGPLTAD